VGQANNTLLRTGSTHVVLLGDSIFDNQRYIGSQSPVIEQVRKAIPADWTATLGAVDGHLTSDVAVQLQKLPADATHLVISIGGNDALSESSVLTRPTNSPAEVFLNLATIRENFDNRYSAMLDQVMATGKPVVLCTIYDPRFENESQQRMCVAALGVFNDVITRAAAKFGLPLIDLRVVFSDAADYANAIEPGPHGGEKIAKLIHQIVATHDFKSSRAVIYV
jgi:lysophospholipase L1-like esterase